MATRKKRRGFRAVSHDPYKVTAAMRRESGWFAPGRMERGPRERKVTVKVAINRDAWGHEGKLQGTYQARACVVRRGSGSIGTCGRGAGSTPTRALQSALKGLSSNLTTRSKERKYQKRRHERSRS